MARSFNLVALAPHLAERVVISRGEMRPDTRRVQFDSKFGRDGFSFSGASLLRLLEGSGFERQPTILVLPTSAVSCRRISFPFQDPRQVGQALRFELENELLEDLTHHRFVHTVVNKDDGTAEAVVYLMKRETLDEALKLFQSKRIALRKITFSASVLLSANPSQAALQFQVYVGAEEVFISMIRSNLLITVKSFPLSPIGTVFRAGDPISEDEKFPLDFGALLDRRRMRKREEAAPADDESGGESSPKGVIGLMERRSTSGSSDSDLFLIRVRKELEAVLPDLNQFIRIHGFNESSALTLHGQFAPYLSWDAEEQSLQISTKPLQSRESERKFMGILEELHINTGELLAPGVVNFNQQRTEWAEQMLELKRPLIAFAAGLAFLVALAGFNLYLNLSAMSAEVRLLEAEIETVLRADLSPGASLANAIPVLEERVAKLQKERDGQSRFTDYDFDALNLLLDLTNLTKDYPNLKVDSITLTPQRFTVAGTTGSYNDSEALRNGLAALEKFKGTEPVIAHQRSAQSISYRISIER